MTLEFTIPGDGADTDEKLVVPQEFEKIPEQYLALKMFGGFKHLGRRIGRVEDGVKESNETARQAVNVAKAVVMQVDSVHGKLIACQESHKLVNGVKEKAKNNIYRAIQIVAMIVGVLAAGAGVMFGMLQIASMFNGSG